MKRFKNNHYPSKRKKKSQKHYTKKCIKVQEQKHLDFMKKIPSDFDHIKPIALQLVTKIAKYNIYDVVTAIFCFNLWRRNRSALAQALSLNMALSHVQLFGNQSIKSYHELEAFYNEISNYMKITSKEDYTIDDFGEIFINYAGKSYPVIIGTGHQQVYAAIRYMQTLATICKRDSELLTLLEYINTIIQSTKNSNIPNLDNFIVFELPTEDFWDAVKMLFKNPYFKKETVAVSKIMGYQFGPIEMRHFILNNGQILPLCNVSLLVDYYKVLLSTATQTEKDTHIVQTICSLVETSYNFSLDTPNRMLVNPIIVDQKSQQQLVLEGLIFAGITNNSLLIAIDQKICHNSNQLSEFIEKIKEINRANGLCILEPFHRHGTPEAYGLKLAPNFNIVYMIIDSFTDIVSHTPRFEFDRESQLFHCTALDVIYLLGFSSDLAEIIDFIRYESSEQAQIFSFGGKSSLFFAWKKSNRLISSGAIEFNHLFLSYNQAEEYTYSHFKDYLCEFPQNGSTLFNDPLNWNVEKSDLGYNRIYHKGCKGFGGEIKAIGCNTYVFLAHNIEFFTKEDFSNEAHTVLKTVDELNQRLIIRYADFINNI